MPLSLPEPSAECLPFGLILQRIALPFFLFAAVLAGVLLLSWFLILPVYTAVDVGGAKHSVESLRAFRADLLSNIETAEADRSQYILPVHDAAYRALRHRREERTSFLSLLDNLFDIASSVYAQPDAVHLSRVSYHAADRTLDVDGDVRFVGPRSMTVLAEFVEAAKKHFVAEAALPRFVREEQEGIGPHSPFTFSLSL